MMFSAMFIDAFQVCDVGFHIRYRFDVKLLVFNLRKLQAKTKEQTDVLDTFLSADGMAENAKSGKKVLAKIDQVSQSCDSYDFTISTEKASSTHVRNGQYTNVKTLRCLKKFLKSGDKKRSQIQRS